MAEKRTVTFTVDTAELFDMLARVNGDFSLLGVRLVGVLLAEPNMIDRIGLAVYGVQVRTDAEAGVA